MEISGAFLFSFLFVGAKSSSEDVIYVPKITDSILSCENFQNDVLDCSGLVLGSTKGEDGEDSAKLGGQIKTLSDITSDHDIEIDIWKLLEIGDEYMYNTRSNFCSSLQNTDAPWFPIIESLNITSCPVPIDVFELDEFKVSLACVKDVMCHDFCGAYRIELSLMDVATKLSCHSIEICIVEEEVDE